MTISYLPREQHSARGDTINSAGFARTGVDLRILVAGGGWAAPGEVGEIVVRSPTVMLEYLGDADATAETLRDGFLHTGDLGYLDDRGLLFVLDRAKDLIISGGSNVYAKAVEDVLMAFPLIKDEAVFGVPHRIWGEVVTAAVVVSSAADPDAILLHCRQHIANYQVPKRIIFVDNLPRNAYGKVLKRELRERYSDRAEPTETLTSQHAEGDGND